MTEPFSLQGTFSLRGRPLLSRATVNRSEQLLTDPERRGKLWPDGRLLLVDQSGAVPVLVSAGTRLAYRRAGDVADMPPNDAVLIGEYEGFGYWALAHHREEGRSVRQAWWEEPTASADEQWLNLRSVGGLLDATDAGVFTTAQAVLNWQRAAGFCARCGTPVEFARAGWVSRCTGCGREEYPRTDPAVICLVHDDAGVNGEQLLLARAPMAPQGRYSVLAGFVEAGESLEDCVIREIGEEVGLAARNVRYLGNQPWPFPRSLMIGFTAVADRSAPLRLADGEIEDAFWVHRDRVRAALAAGGITDDFALPGGISIARQMVEAWALAE